MPDYHTEPSEKGGRRQILWVTFFLLLAVTAVNLPASGQQQVASLLRDTVLRPFVWIQETRRTVRLTAAENAQLVDQLDSMVALATSRTTLLEENRRLRSLLSLAERAGREWLPASAIRAGSMGSESSFHLDRGQQDGVSPRAPLITRHGLVGQVREVQPNAAIAMDWTHPEFGASAMSEDGATYGMIETFRGDFREEDRMLFNGTAFQTSLEVGTTVLTSGLGGVYPRGIPIGRITGLAEAEAGWHKSYWVEPLVAPGGVTHVLVAVGDSASRPTDVSELWPRDSVLSEAELMTLEDVRIDSLPILRDSVAAMMLRLERTGARLDSLEAEQSGRGRGAARGRGGGG